MPELAIHTPCSCPHSYVRDFREVNKSTQIITSIDFKNFPTTRYQGSKRKLLPWLFEAFKEIKFNTVLDAFGGTGSVSYLFKSMNKCVTYNDLLNFNFITGQAIIENSGVSLNEEEVTWLLKRHDDVPYLDVVERNFKDIYFLDHENAWLDQIICNINSRYKFSTSREAQFKQALAYHCLFQSSLIKRPYNLFHRKNLNLRLAENISRSFGNKTSWDTSFETHFLKFVKEVNRLVFDSKLPCKATNRSVFDIDPYGFDLIYLDPPYYSKGNSSATSNYLNSYHFLEGMTRYNDWESLIDYSTINHRLGGKLKEEISKTTIESQIEELIYKFRFNKLVISYKDAGIPSLETLLSLIKKIRGNVKHKLIPYKYALNRTKKDAKQNSEVLIISH